MAIAQGISSLSREKNILPSTRAPKCHFVRHTPQDGSIMASQERRTRRTSSRAIGADPETQSTQPIDVNAGSQSISQQRRTSASQSNSPSTQNAGGQDAGTTPVPSRRNVVDTNRRSGSSVSILPQRRSACSPLSERTPMVRRQYQLPASQIVALQVSILGRYG